MSKHCNLTLAFPNDSIELGVDSDSIIVALVGWLHLIKLLVWVGIVTLEVVNDVLSRPSNHNSGGSLSSCSFDHL